MAQYWDPPIINHQVPTNLSGSNKIPDFSHNLNICSQQEPGQQAGAGHDHVWQAVQPGQQVIKKHKKLEIEINCSRIDLAEAVEEAKGGSKEMIEVERIEEVK